MKLAKPILRRLSDALGKSRGTGSPRCCAKATKPTVSGLASSGCSVATDEVKSDDGDPDEAGE
jgi:hypothetical protein